MNQYRLLAAAVTAGCAAMPAEAQTNLAAAPDAADGEIVVTGTRASEPTRVDQNGGAITVIDADALDRRQVRTVSDVLRDVPGVAVSRIAGQTQVRLRGTEANQVLVLVDGIEVSDPYAGEFDFGTLAADDAARVEVLRGQQSAIYGSDAVGGVIQYVTLTGRESPGYSARVEAGSFGTLNGAARAAGVSGDLDYALSGTINTTDGRSNARAGGRDLKNDTGAASFKGTWSPAVNARITAVGRYSRTAAEFNDTQGDPSLAGLIWRAAVRDDNDEGLALADLQHHLIKRRKGRAGIGGIPAVRLRRVFHFVERELASSVSTADMAAVAGMSMFHFSRVFTEETGTTPHRYVLGRRIARAVARLEEGRVLEDVAFECGFANASHLAQHLRRGTGTTSQTLRKFLSS